MKKSLSIEFLRALYRVADDPEVKAVWGKGAGNIQTVMHLFGYDTQDPVRLSEKIKRFMLREAEATEAAEQDVSRQHFSIEDCALLGQHEQGKPLLNRMADGDETAVPEATALLQEIRRVRKELGLES